MNRHKGSITLGAGLLGAVLVSVPMLAANVFGAPQKITAAADLSSGSSGLTPLQLEAQVVALKDEIKTLRTELTKYRLSAVFVRPSLKPGDQGDDIKGLQIFLGAIPDVYPENVQSGKYGPATERAVRVFQDREGLKINGKVDVETMQKVFDLIISSELDSQNTKIAALLASATPEVRSNNNQNINTDETTNQNNAVQSFDGFGALQNSLDNIGQFLNVDFTPPTLSNTLLPSPSTLSAITGALCGGSVDLTWTVASGATAYVVFRDNAQIVQTTNTTYTDTGLSTDSGHIYYVESTNGIGTSPNSNTASATASSACSLGGASSTTSPSTAPAPAITNISVSSIQTNSVKISWQTDIAATSQVKYGTTVSYGNGSALDSTTLKSHSVTITGLSRNTLYHFSVVSVANGVSASSPDQTFTTKN